MGDLADGLRSALVGDSDIGHTGFGALPSEQVRVSAASGQADQLEAIRVGGDHL